MTNRNTFILKTDYESVITEMSDKQAGALIKAIFKYVATGDSTDHLPDVEVRMAFRFIKSDLDAFDKKYQETSLKRAEAGKKGGVAKQANAT